MVLWFADSFWFDSSHFILLYVDSPKEEEVINIMAIPSVNIIPRLGTATHSTVGPDKKEVELFLRSYSLTWPKLNDYQKSQLIGVESEPICESTDRACIWKGYRCYIQSWLALATDQDQAGGATHDSPHYNPTLPSENFCPYKFDGHVCWPFQSPGQRTFIPCSQAIPLEDFQNCQSLLRKCRCGGNVLFIEITGAGISLIQPNEAHRSCRPQKHKVNLKGHMTFDMPNIPALNILAAAFI